MCKQPEMFGITEDINQAAGTESAVPLDSRVLVCFGRFTDSWREVESADGVRGPKTISYRASRSIHQPIALTCEAKSTSPICAVALSVVHHYNRIMRHQKLLSGALSI